MAPKVWSVTQVVRGANRMLEAKFSNLWIEGEVGSLKISGTGHAFFTLADADAALPAAMWRASVQALPFELKEGQKLRCLGRLGIFAKQGRFQFYVDRAEPVGLGARMLALEQCKQRLTAQGLFAQARKRVVPAWPRVIGVVTSGTGAAIHDILEVARQRCPSRIVLCPALVQGPDAPRSLISGLSRIVSVPGVDVVILGRGGGSAEDLWCFNDEALVRAVVDCPVPVVSAVGHEVDTSLCDLAADLRAATPSHAAELIVPDLQAAQARLRDLQGRLLRALSRAALDQRGRLQGAISRLATTGRALTGRRRSRLRRAREALDHHHPRQRLHRDRRRLDAATSRLHAAALLGPRRARLTLATLGSRMTAAIAKAPRRDRVRLARLAGSLHALSPLAVLGRGYSVLTQADGRALLDAGETSVGEALSVRLHRGTLGVAVTDCHPEPTPGKTPDGDPNDKSGAP